MREPNIFSKRGMDLMELWHKEKLLYMYAHGVYGSLTFNELTPEQVEKFYMGFMDTHTSQERTLCGAEINERYPKAEQFWRWYDSAGRIRNQLRNEEGQKNDGKCVSESGDAHSERA